MSARKVGSDAFEYYASLGAARSYKALAEHYGVSKRAITKRAASENWAQRLEDIERRAREKTDAKLVDHLGEMRERHLKTARYMQAKALRAMQEYPLKSGMEAVKAAEAAIRLERLVVGEVTERTAIDVEAVTKKEMERWLMPPPEDVEYTELPEPEQDLTV